MTGWGDTQLKVHLARLAALEYVLVHRVRSGQGYEYELLYDGEGETGDRFVMGLADPAASPTAHGYDDQRSGVEPQRSATGRDAVAGRSGGGQPPESGPIPSAVRLSGEGDAEPAEADASGARDLVPSYAQPEA